MRTTGFSLPWLLREIVLYLGASPWSLWHQLDELRELDDRLLHDIGLSRTDIVRSKPEEPDVHGMLMFVVSGLSRGV